MTDRTIAPALLALLLILAAAPAHSSSPLPAAKSNHFASNLQYTGGTGTGYVLQQVRWGDHHTFERLVLEFSGPDASVLPRMKVETEFYPMRLAVRLPGSGGRGDPLYPGENPFARSRLLSGLDTFEACGGGQHLTLIPARPVEFDVFTLTAPPRLVIDVMLSRMDPMREEQRYSVRTFPLYGDQVCVFLDEAAEAGVTPRLISDEKGNVFGELGLFNTADEAFTAVERWKDSLGKRFALTVKARGMMTVPAELP